MQLRVLYFAAAREAAGTTETSVDVPEGTTVEGLFRHLGASSPALRDVLANCRAAVDEEFAAPAAPLVDGQVVAVLPPVSGG